MTSGARGPHLEFGIRISFVIGISSFVIHTAAIGINFDCWIALADCAADMPSLRIIVTN